MLELIIAITVFAATGLAFVAYHHPDQYRSLSTVCLVVWSVGYAFLLGAWGSSELDMQLIQESWLPDDQKAHALDLLKHKPLDFVRKVINNIAFFSAWYVAGLGFLPWLGLTAEAKRREQAHERELADIERRLFG
jgi:hypothetical protein